MLLAEKVLLFLINEKKNKLYSTFRGGNGRFTCGGLTIACLLDLYLKKKISFEKSGKRRIIINLIDDSSTGDSYLDTLIAEIKAYKKERYFSKIRFKLSNLKRRNWRFYDVINMFLERLDKQGIIKHEKDVAAYGGGSDIIIKPEVKKEIRDNIRAIVLENKDPDLEMLCLLTLIRGFRLFVIAFTWEHNKEAKKRIRELLEPFIPANKIQDQFVGLLVE